MNKSELEIKKAETKLLQSSAKDLIKNLNNYFNFEKRDSLTLKEKNRHNL